MDRRPGLWPLKIFGHNFLVNVKHTNQKHMKQLKGVGIGAGYFSHFQYEAWQRIPEVNITAMCNTHKEKAVPIMEKYGIDRHYVDYQEMIVQEKPDFVDVITPPDTHLEICKFAADQGIDIICQKPLAPEFEEAKAIVDYVHSKGVKFMVHENFRFQPWHREIKKLLEKRAVGNVFTLAFRSRMGDGWGNDAYLARQPYFQKYPRFLVYENGVHFIDTFRYLNGEINKVCAYLRKLNPVIAGEDCVLINFEFDNGSLGLWDANRYNESNYENPRYTFGEFLIEGEEGSIRLFQDGTITVQNLGKGEKKHDYYHRNHAFSGDCCYNIQRHFVDQYLSDQEFETNGDDYLRTLAVQEAVYQSGQVRMPVAVKYS
jgi:D-apiose dehydrogenase